MSFCSDELAGSGAVAGLLIFEMRSTNSADAWSAGARLLWIAERTVGFGRQAAVGQDQLPGLGRVHQVVDEQCRLARVLGLRVDRVVLRRQQGHAGPLVLGLTGQPQQLQVRAGGLLVRAELVGVRSSWRGAGEAGQPRGYAVRDEQTVAGGLVLV